MYATLSYDLNAGPEPIDDLRMSLIALFADRDTCDLLADTFICDVESGADFFALEKKLKKIGSDFDGQFIYVFTLHRTGSPLRSNATYPKAKARSIIDPEAGQ
jgi:hypothetical protein